MTLAQLSQDPAYTSFLENIRVWSLRISDDPRIYQHLFIHGQFWVNTRIAHGLIIWGGVVGIDLLRFFAAVERVVVNEAAIYQILYHPRG